MESSDSRWSLLEARTHTSQIRFEMTRLCPTMDLIAFVTVEQRVEIFRFGGQRAFMLQRKEPNLEVSSICWKYNGQYLAVSWSDGLVDVLSSETGSPLQMFRQVTSFHENLSTASGPVSSVGWGLSLVDPSIAKKTWASSSNEVPSNLGHDGLQDIKDKLEDLLDREPDVEAVGLPTDLADQLAQLDVTDYMPKLPPLSMPTTSRHGQTHLAELFSSQTLLDAALHQGSARELHALNAFLVSHPGGSIRIVLYDSLSIGNVPMPVPTGFQVQHLTHTSHPLAHCHVVLSEYSNGAQFKTLLTPVSFRFLKSAGKNIHFIDFKTAQLELLVQYVGEAITAVEHHWKHAQDLPSRFQANISETLQEKEEPNLPQSLYQLATTGYSTETLKEWLTDELAERGHKRWDHSINQGYTKVLELLQENLLPALDRCTAILSNLQGLAQYHEHSTAFDVPLSSFSLLLDIIRCIRLIAHHMILLASQEYHHFLAFSRWLRHAISIQGTDPASAAGEEALEKDPGIDYLSVMTYIQGALEQSKIVPFLFESGGYSGLKANPNMYDDLKKALKLPKESTRDEGILKLSSYYSEWKMYNRTLIEQITAWQRKTTVCAGGIVLSDDKVQTADMRMVWKASQPSFVSTYTATVNASKPSRLNIHHIIHSELFDDVSDNVECVATTLTLQNGDIVGCKFIDDKDLILLVNSGAESHLISLQYADSEVGRTKLSYQKASLGSSSLPDGAPPQVEAEQLLSLSGDLQSYTRQTINHEREAFVPASLDVNGRKNRRTCVVVGEDKRQIRIYDLGIEDAIGGAVE